MLVTFQSRSYADITMFGEVAIHLLHLMGHSGSVPGAIQAEDIPEALRKLKTALASATGAKAPPSAPDKPQDEGEERVSLEHRALPLIKLLEAAIADESDVMWSS